MQKHSNLPPVPEPRNDWLAQLARLNERFGRFARDAFGIFLFAAALMTLLALRNFTEGAALTPWVEFLSLWFGWGSYLAALGLGYFGFLAVRRSGPPLGWGRLSALLLASLLTLGLLAAIGGGSLIRAEAGADGGRIGWGLITLFWRIDKLWGMLLLLVLWFFFSMTGLGIWALLERWLLKLAGEAPPPQVATQLEIPVEAKVEEKAEHPTRKKSPATALPPEFRKSLRVADQKDKKPAAPRDRDDRLPSLNALLADQNARPDERTINQTAGMIEKTLAEFGVAATVIGFRVGPTVTQFAVQPGFMKKAGATEEDTQQMKVRVAQIASLQKDLTLALSAERLRIEAPVPGKPYVGIEVPNSHTSVVRMRAILETDAFHKIGTPLAMALGRDVSGQPLTADLARMPHLLIAGATGSGKSVCITALAACFAMNNPPEDLRMVMIDSKMVELLRFNGLPHLYGKVETNVERILGVLRWVVVEMEHRYRLLEGARARDLETYNRRLSKKKDGAPLPRIVVLIDELADLMMSAPDQTEHNLVRLAQMARATGIHLIVATQRPSTDVVTGLIKANFPARLAFAVASGVDSRVILDTTGAENLLGRGDMLFLNPESGSPIRAQGVMITDMEIERIIAHWKKNADDADVTSPWEKLLSEPDENEDEELIEKAVTIVRQSQRASASLLQRRLRIGYPRAARLLDQLEEMGVVGPSQGGGKERDVLVEPLDEELGDIGK
ncbi:MAG TPA: DNA translocase FtsK [Anaerolineales bacterium]|jgi:S-DNA-T family DNA segregation ATPase FtsK/SpoIIIE|nr:DNA translocase FtsK [Anaerolineales bacterium]